MNRCCVNYALENDIIEISMVIVEIIIEIYCPYTVTSMGFS